MYYGHLQGNKEYLFKQSSFGGVWHIVVDATEYIEAFAKDQLSSLRIDTWCQRNYKYSTYSEMTVRDAGVRNACEYCFVEYEPEDRAIERRARNQREVLEGGLPF